MGAIIPFESQLPAHLASLFPSDVADEIIAGASGGFPSLSIKGKTFTVVRGDERLLLKHPETKLPAQAIELVIVRANPGFSKNFYKGEYVDGSDEKPTCYSNDGIAPAADAQEKQSVSCGNCIHNQWGSRKMRDGQMSKGKACADVRKLAVAPSGSLKDPMLLRVPGASLKPLAEYGKVLKARGVPFQAVLTELSFDFTLPHPELRFTPKGILGPELCKEVAEMRDSDIVRQILGLDHMSVPALPAPVAAAPAPVAQPVSQPVPSVADPVQPVASPTAAAVVAAQVGAIAAPTPETKPAKSKPAEVAGDDLAAKVSSLLSGAGFDD